MDEELDASGIGRRENEARVDLVFDFDGQRSPDLGALCLMLTARIMADDSHRKVWLHALPEPTWRLLNAMGLEHYFELVPPGGETVE